MFILGPTKIVSLPSQLKVVKAQSFQLMCQIFNEEGVISRILWLFNQHQSVPKEKLLNESTILIETPQNHDTVSEINCFD